jgi:hypothetical protein
VEGNGGGGRGKIPFNVHHQISARFILPYPHSFIHSSIHLFICAMVVMSLSWKKSAIVLFVQQDGRKLN